MYTYVEIALCNITSRLAMALHLQSNEQQAFQSDLHQNSVSRRQSVALR